MIAPTTHADVLSLVYDDILRPSFPDAELLERDAFLHAAETGGLEVLVSTDGRHIQGAIVGEQHDRAVLIAWLAVGAQGRSGGVGGALLRAGVAHWLAQPATDIVLAEVERPDIFDPHPVYGDPSRRLAFYARTSAGVLDLPYFQAPMGPGLPRVHGLLLTVLGTADAAPAPRRLNRAETAAVQEYLHDVLGSDPEAAPVIAAATKDDGIRLLPLADYAVTPLSGGLSPRS
ncbi:N-acetyltransferase [Microbacterium invictum]|uniref:N-acetyltransferase domain-containing protein n=1 Tax=Microbacterium invictum TaxID=515415 RepID=A0AA40SMI8_9MICO|nr:MULTISPECIES: N-acetyltransferase [Microbacterium]MBB4138936.1 hypothetical protein [Microbacterium invictum]